MGVWVRVGGWVGGWVCERREILLPPTLMVSRGPGRAQTHTRARSTLMRERPAKKVTYGSDGPSSKREGASCLDALCINTSQIRVKY